MRLGLHQGCPLSPILFITFMGRISRHSQGAEQVQIGDFTIMSLLFAIDVVVELFAATCEVVVKRMGTSKSDTFVLSWKGWNSLSRSGSEVLLQGEQFEYLRVLVTSEGRMELDRWISAASAVKWTLYWSAVVKRELSQLAR